MVYATVAGRKAPVKSPCAPVEYILKEDNAVIYERVDHRNNRTILYASDDNSRMIRESTMRGYARDKAAHNKIDGLFSTDAESPFANYSPKLKQTAIFIHRLLLGESYEEIAARFNTTADNAAKLYGKAQARILKALDLCDQHQSIIDKAEYALQAGEEATGKLPKYVKWFLMAKCLGLTPVDIAKLEGTTRGIVSPKIRYAYDRLITGEMKLIRGNTRGNQSGKDPNRKEASKGSVG